jgi:predicted transposase YbfD/YdcC
MRGWYGRICIELTSDAMGCQRDIADKIVNKKADYVLALKGNQGTLFGMRRRRPRSPS